MAFRDAKRETLIELIDVLDEQYADELLHVESILAASIKMIDHNIFRAFSNKSKFNFSYFVDKQKNQ